MRSFRWNKQGQFVVVAALIIAAFTLFLVLSISKINLNTQDLSYKPVQELVLGLASDFDRCLTYALSLATHEYNETGSMEEAITTGNIFITKWINSTLSSYSNLGLEIVLNASETGATDIEWGIDWNSSSGISYVYTSFNLNINAYGFRGWTSYSTKTVWLNILEWNASTNTIEFQIMQSKEEGFEPIPSLTPEDVQVKVYTLQRQNMIVGIGNLTYLGYGRYRLTFGADSEEVVGVTLTAVTPEDNIVVSARTGGEWSSIYLSSAGQGLGQEQLVPASQLQGRNGFVTTPVSHGQEVVDVYSVQTDRNITIPPQIQMKLFFEPSTNSSGNINITVALGFQFENETYWIGNDTKQIVAGLHPYKFTINATSGEYPEEYGERVIPEGSVFILRIVAISEGGFGSIKLHYGPKYLSRIKLS